MKRVLSVVLAVVMMSSLLSVSALAAGPDSVKEFRNGKASIVRSCFGSAILSLQQDGSLWGWGRAEHGSLGNRGGFDKEDKSLDVGSQQLRSYPEKVLTGVKWLETNSSSDISLVIKEDDSLWYSGAVTGYDTLGVLITKSYYQTEFAKLMDHVTSAAIGYTHNGEVIYAVDKSGALWQFSFEKILDSGTGVLIIGETPTPSSYHYELKKEKLMESVQKVSGGSHLTLVLKVDGSVWGWGNTDRGGLGNGIVSRCDNEEELSFTNPIQILTGVKDIYANVNTAAAIKQDGSLWMWGRLPSGDQGTPLKVADGVKKVTSNEFNFDIAILKEDGTLYMWGATSLSKNWGSGSTEQKVPVKTTLTDVADVAVSFYTTFYIKSDGSLYAWGSDRLQFYGVDYQPVQLTGFATTAPTTPTTSTFTDVVATSPYYAAIQWAVKENITAGTTATTFAPGATCTNAQILTFLWRAKGQPAPTIANPFTDVKESNYYYKAALWAYENNMVAGTDFNAATPATRSQTVTYLWTLAGKPSAAKSIAFTDVDDDADYAKAVAWAVEKGITTGTSAATFAPDATCTRGQIVTFLYRDMTK